MMQVNRMVAVAVSPQRAASPVPLAFNTGKVGVAPRRFASARSALQTVHLEESRSCVPMALQEAHVQSIRQYAAMLATGLTTSSAKKRRAPLQKAPRALAAQSQACVLPAGASKCSLITEGDATVGPKLIYSCLAVGGTLYDGSPKSSAVVKGPASYLHKSGGEWEFSGGSTKEPLKFDWDEFSLLAQTAQSSESGEYKVVVLTKGGSYNLYDFRPGGQGTDEGKTLVIFNTVEDVILAGIDGRQFGPSVLAPFSKVTLLGNAGYLDGCLFAKTFVSDDEAADSLQLHGKCYSGPLDCGPTVPTATTTQAPVTEPAAMTTTQAPTTTTEAPTTEAPITAEPIEITTTQAPTTKASTTKAPTTETPVTEAPITDAPATEKPTEGPVTDAPATEAPATEAPATEATATEAPATDAPATDAPATEAPATEAPVTDATATQAPGIVGPVVPTAAPGGFTCDGDGFKEATSLCCPEKTEAFFTGLLGCMGLEVCSMPHIQGLMHWFTCVPDMDFQYVLDVINDGNPCKYWTPIGQACPALSAQCEGKWCR